MIKWIRRIIERRGDDQAQEVKIDFARREAALRARMAQLRLIREARRGT